MRIAHVVTLISNDNAFGGPVSVAKAQAEELARRGHDVTLLAGWDGVAECEVPGVNVRLHKTRQVIPSPGFSGLAAWGLYRELAGLLPAIDVVHLHLARDLVAIPAGLLVDARSVKLVTQTHGMVMPDTRPIARLIDFAATRRILKRARRAAVLTAVEDAGLRRVARGPIRTVDLANGVALAAPRNIEPAQLPATVLFCARLHPRKRVIAFAEMAHLMISRGSEARFVVAGPDEGDRQRLLDYISAHDLDGQLEYIGPLPSAQVREHLANASVFVLPSEREPFPMTLLEAMAEGTPAVITDGCMISPRLAAAGGPLVTDGSPQQMAVAVSKILRNPEQAAAISDRSRQLIREEFSIETVVDHLVRIYAS